MSDKHQKRSSADLFVVPPVQTQTQGPMGSLGLALQAVLDTGEVETRDDDESVSAPAIVQAAPANQLVAP